MQGWLPRCLIAAALLETPGMVAAQELVQERLFAIVPANPGFPITLRRIVEIDTRTASFGAITREWPLTVEQPDFNNGLHPLAGGRYLVWTSGLLGVAHMYPIRPLRLNVFDTQSGLMHAIDHAVYGDIIAVDEQRARIFLDEPQRVAIVEARSGRIDYIPGNLDAPAYQRLPRSAAYAAGSDRLFVRSAAQWSAIDVVDVASRAIVRTISTDPDGVSGLATNRDGARLFTLSGGGGFVSAFDAVTGTRLGRVSVSEDDTLFTWEIQFDEARNLLLVGAVVVFDADTLQRLGTARGACVGEACRFSQGPGFTLHGPRSPLLVLTSRTGVDYTAGTGGCAYAPLQWRDPDTGQLMRVADLAPLANVIGVYTGRCVIQMTMTTVPAAPRELTSEVHGRRVTLSWIDPGNTTHFQIEAGSAPGLANMYQQASGSPSLVVDDVPPGTYYVRVRAVNYVGRSVPAEIAILVP